MFISELILFYIVLGCDSFLKNSLYVMKVEDTALQGFQNAKYLDISQRMITLERELRSDAAQVKVIALGGLGRGEIL